MGEELSEGKGEKEESSRLEGKGNSKGVSPRRTRSETLVGAREVRKLGKSRADVKEKREPKTEWGDTEQLTLIFV